MAIKFFQWSGGSTSGIARGVTAWGAGTVTLTGTLAAAQPGWMVSIYNSTTNDGYYTITQYIGANQYRIVPAPNIEAAAGSAQLYSLASQKGGADAITAFVAGNKIQAATATFITDGVQVHDRVRVQGSGGQQSNGGNDGAWFVVSVDSQTQLTVRPLNGEAGVVAGAGAGTVYVYQGSVKVLLDQESGTKGFSDILSSATPMVQQAPGTSSFVAGTAITEYLTQVLDIIAVRKLWLAFGILEIECARNSSPWCDFVSTNEIVINQGNKGNLIFAMSGGGTNNTCTLGSDGGGNRIAALSGSAWIGVQFSTNVGFTGNLYGSYMDVNSGASLPGGSSGQALVHGSLLREGALVALFTSSFEVESSLFYGSTGLVTLSGNNDFANVTVTQQSGAGGMVDFSGAWPNVYVEGLLISDLIPVGGIWQLWGVHAYALNPREDYDINSELVFTLFGAADCFKQYTFNPRFVSRDPSGFATPAPMEGLTVQMWWIWEATGAETSLGMWTTDANGRLSGIESDRDGINLTRQYYAAATGVINISQRIRVEGVDANTKQAIRPVNTTFTMRSELDFDFAIDVLSTDFEGETSN